MIGFGLRGKVHAKGFGNRPDCGAVMYCTLQLFTQSVTLCGTLCSDEPKRLVRTDIG